MAIPRIDFYNFAVNMLPFGQRKPKWIIFTKALLSQIQRLYGIFRGYTNGESLEMYNPSFPYVKGSKVQYNFKTWESLVDDNLGFAPSSSPAAWILRNNNFIGTTERSKYNGRYLELTYALNRNFSTVFRQPPYPAPYDYGLGGGTWSDIYITNEAPVYTSFIVGIDEASSSDTFTGTSTGYVFTIGILSGASSYKFIVNIPITVYNAQGATDSIRNSIFNSFIALYAVSGTTWELITY